MTEQLDPKWIVEMDRATLTEFLPGTEEMPDKDRYYATAARFNLVGRTAYNTSLIVGDGSHSLEALKAGIIDFKLPGRNKDGKLVTLQHSTAAADEKVFEALPSTVANWLWDLVAKLNPMFPVMSEEEQQEAAEELAETRAEIQELQELEAAPEVDQDDPLPGSDGLPASPTEGAAEVTPESSTQSRQRT